MREGLARSAGVMERMMASVRRICFSPSWASSSVTLPPMPGIMSRMLEREPIFFIWPICSSRSLKSSCPSFSFLAVLAAVSWSIWVDAFSMRVITSPKPRIRDAIRSG